VPYDHIAVCLDTSDAGEAALREAAALRAATPGRLTLVHVATPPRIAGYSRWEPPEVQTFMLEARAWLEGVAAGIPGATAVVLHGDRPAHRVVAWAAESGCDLLVAASHDSALERLGLGGFARHLAHAAPCAVLLARPR
jgi:nucleotide-binding universal stress UspA family protein